MTPTVASGKICYIDIPETVITRSSDSSKRVFGWTIRPRGDGCIDFADRVSEVNGTWLYGRKSGPESGLLVYVMVDDMAVTLDAIVTIGGHFAQPIGDDEIAVRLRAPAASAVGLYQGSA